MERGGKEIQAEEKKPGVQILAFSSPWNPRASLIVLEEEKTNP